MAECQPSETNPTLPGMKNHLENPYPTHIENTVINIHQCSKSEKQPPNGVKLVTAGINGCSKCSSENEDETECTKRDELCLENCKEKTSSEEVAESKTDSSDLNIDRLAANVDSVCLSSKEEEDTETSEGIDYVVYESELQMPDIIRLITKDLSEPYSIYTYRYFIHNWPKLCFLAMDQDKCVGAIVCKLDMHKKMVRRGYIAMLAVDSDYRRKKIGSHLVLKAIKAMIMDDCDEVVLETEITNQAALRLYENLGFVRDKRLFRYYLNGVDALRLKLWLR